MERSVEPSFISGQIKSPPSKSMTQRAVAAAILAEGRSTIINPSYCDDSLAGLSIAVGLGAKVYPGENKVIIDGCREVKEKKLNCGESGLAIRMFSPIAALFPDEIIMLGSGSLKKRPMFMIGDALSQLGVRCLSTDGFLPLTIQGPIKGGHCEIDGSMSSQLLTGLLMALPLTNEDSQITVSNLKSRPYVDMTINVLKDFGIRVNNDEYNVFRIPGRQSYNARDFEVEGDWSGGAFIIVAGAINGNLTVTGLRADSCQSDKAIIKALEKAEARIRISEDTIEISKSAMKAFEFDATESPDLFPPLVVLAAYCTGTSKIKGASRLFHKESNRAAALIEEFGKMNIEIKLEGDLMVITGGEVKGARISSHDDHRIAMAGAIAALGAKGKVSIRDSHCVAKSYPGFFEDLRKVGAVVYE
jgi:3-phosphoshikimate 1-carboxyvinyltransferase